MPERLRIAQVAPINAPVTPDSRDSIEQLVSLLTEELVRRGHVVTLFATGDSQTSASLHATYPRGYSHDGDLWNWQFHETMHMAAAFERAHEFDVIHSHAYHFALQFTRLVRTPVVHTYHILPDQDVARAYARYPETHIVATSHYQRRKFEGILDAPVIYHGIDTSAFPFSPVCGDYLFFLGRMIDKKGPVGAIRIAKESGMRLIMAGPGEDYFRNVVQPLIDGHMVEYVGPVGAKERNRLLAGAGALLYPIVSPEPFGLVMVEAMACGTPVAALGLGAVPEIVENGVTGYYTDDPQLLVAHIPAVLALDRFRIQKVAETRFNYQRMVDDYLVVYRRLADGQQKRAT